MKKIRLSLAIILISLFFVSCNNDDNGSNGGSGGSDDSFVENFGSEVSRDFIGQIVDMNNLPISGASVKIGSTTVQTDANGMFVLNGASVYQKHAFIKVSKPGFIDGSRAVVPTNGKNTIRIMMIPSTPTATIASGNASEVTLPDGTKVAFDGSFQDENGNAYSGAVQVSLFHLTTSDSNLSQLMPGSFYASNENGAEAVLETFGMIHVQLTGSGGQKLQLADNHTAEITVKVDPSQLASAPATIPLWSFNEEHGFWKQDGTATRQGNNYVGTVSHFSWWNCDAQFPTVNLCVRVVTSSGQPVANTQVLIYRAGSTYPVYGYSNGNGEVCGLIPSNEILTMKVLDNCGNVASTSTVGPFSADTDLGNITLNSSVQTTVVQGTLLKCDNSNVTEGYVYLSYGNQSYFAEVEDGDFSFTTLLCQPNQTFTLQGFDYENVQTTGNLTYTFNTPLTVVGNLQVCTSLVEFISYQLDGEDTVILPIVQGGLNASAGGLSVQGSGIDNTALYIWGSTIVPGTYSTPQFSFEGTIGYTGTGNVNTIIFQLNNFGAVGEYIDMTFSGTYQQFNGSNTPVDRTVTGVVHVIRD
jgi:hypothetical protein